MGTMGTIQRHNRRESRFACDVAPEDKREGKSDASLARPLVGLAQFFVSRLALLDCRVIGPGLF